MKKTIQLFLTFCILITLLASGCTSAPSQVLPEAPQAATPATANLSPSTSSAEQQNADKHYTISEIGQLAGFAVKGPVYLPAGVSLDFATYEAPAVTLHFKLVHEQYGDMGAFFQILQQPETEAPPDTISCRDNTEGCEMIQINNMPVVYTLNAGGTEGLNWYANGVSFRLLRTAGEPNKVYKDELVKVVESMK